MNEIIAKQKKELQACVTRPGSGLWAGLMSIDHELKAVLAQSENSDDACDHVEKASEELHKLINMLSVQ